MKFSKVTLFLSCALASMALPPPILAPIGEKCKKALDGAKSDVSKCFKVALSDNIAFCKDKACEDFKVPAAVAEACAEERQALKNYNLQNDFSNFDSIIRSACKSDLHIPEPPVVISSILEFTTIPISIVTTTTTTSKTTPAASTTTKTTPAASSPTTPAIPQPSDATNPQNSQPTQTSRIQKITEGEPLSSDASKLTYSVLAATLAVAANLLL